MAGKTRRGGRGGDRQADRGDPGDAARRAGVDARATQLAATLEGTAAAGVVAAMAGGSLVDTAAQRLIEMEARDNTNSAKIAELIRGLRKQGETDAIASIPGLPMAEKQALLADPVGRREQLVRAHGKRYVDGFIADLRGAPPRGGRPWARSSSSADSENEEMLNALVDGRRADGRRRRAALRDPQEGRRRDQGGAAEAATQERVKTLEDAVQGEVRRRPERELLFGRLGAEFAMGPRRPCSANAGGVVRGRDAAHVDGVPQRRGGEGGGRRQGGRRARQGRQARGRRHGGQQRRDGRAARARATTPRRRR